MIDLDDLMAFLAINVAWAALLVVPYAAVVALVEADAVEDVASPLAAINEVLAAVWVLWQAPANGFADLAKGNRVGARLVAIDLKSQAPLRQACACDGLFVGPHAEGYAVTAPESIPRRIA